MKFKIWLYFLIFVIIVGILIWFLQVFSLNNYYEGMKIASNEATVSRILYSQKEYENDETKFINSLHDIVSEDDIFVKIAYDNAPIYSSSSQVELYKSETDKARDYLKSSSEKEGVSLVLKGTKTNRQTWVYAGYMDKEHKSILYVVSPLYPVASTVKILQQQLVYVLILSLIISIGFAFFTSQKISSPIRKISENAKKLAVGNYGVIFDENYNYEEINDLARTLNRASIEIDKSFELQKDLISNISHDLKTPLTMVKSYAEMIRDLSGDDPIRRNAHLQVIIDESDRLNTLVNDILTLSAAQSGSLKLNIQSFSIAQLFSSVISTYDILQEQEGYTIMFNCRQDVDVIGDPTRIKQVISNLITNAVKYCGEDKCIYVNVKKWGQKVHCEIVDHGQGIKAEELPYIWERYYKSSTNHVRSTTGSGIGLSIVKEILHAHNARCGVESKVGRGTTFWFELEVAPTDISQLKRK